ncbi:hypothetical protein F511_29300 [Dorcoceras hygrometricum]|uniref:Uncharacterized protein n=1 Tax=Dorcoceras hygrometricum TaxID=472368 RepID=A0A2Z7AVI6_9LAMI|nr:hypothetical protein F511_29300 [Dorcoceras hygrometricum]
MVRDTTSHELTAHCDSDNTFSDLPIELCKSDVVLIRTRVCLEIRSELALAESDVVLIRTRVRLEIRSELALAESIPNLIFLIFIPDNPRLLLFTRTLFPSIAVDLRRRLE